MRDNYKSINASIDNLTKDSRDHMRRIEKIEAELINLNNADN